MIESKQFNGTKCSYGHDRMEDFMQDALFGIETQGHCECSPESLTYLGAEDLPHSVLEHFRCRRCGEEIVEEHSRF